MNNGQISTACGEGAEDDVRVHPLRLMMRVETAAEKIVAVLRDVVEDSQPPQRWGFDELRREAFPSPC